MSFIDPEFLRNISRVKSTALTALHLLMIG